MENKIYIVIHPIKWELVYGWEPGMSRLSKDTAKKILEWVEPFIVDSISGVKSKATAETIFTELVLCPLTMEQMTDISQRKVYNTVLRCARLAKNKGSPLTGLVAYAALVGSYGEKVQQTLNIPITTGLSLSVAALFAAIIKASLLIPGRFNNVLVLGTNSLSAFLLEKLAGKTETIHLWSRSKNKAKFHQALPEKIRQKVKLLPDGIEQAITEASLIINATPGMPPGFDEKLLKKGAIVVDASYPRAITIKREDVLLIDGAAIIMPGKPACGFNFGLPEGLCFPCMAEPMVLALEKRFESYTLGEHISGEKADAIYHAAIKHGFKLGPLTCNEIVIPEERLERFKQISLGGAR